jgi:hypothetical protein
MGGVVVYRPELYGDPAVSLDTVKDVLSLVNVQADMSVMERWSPLERCVVTNWAYRVHLSASDNLNRVPPRPYLVLAEWGGEGSHELERR